MTFAPPRVYLDTNLFIAAFESSGPVSDHAWLILNGLEEGMLLGVTSLLTLAELLVRPMATDRRDLVESYQAMFRSAPMFRVMPVNRDVIIEAAAVRSRRKSIKLPDALHIATAHRHGCAFFISGDRRLSLPSGMKQLRIEASTVGAMLGHPA